MRKRIMKAEENKKIKVDKNLDLVIINSMKKKRKDLFEQIDGKSI